MRSAPGVIIIPHIANLWKWFYLHYKFQFQLPYEPGLIE